MREYVIDDRNISDIWTSNLSMGQMDMSDISFSPILYYTHQM